MSDDRHKEMQGLGAAVSGMSPEAIGIMKGITQATYDLIDDLPALERITVRAEDHETLKKHLATLHRLRQLRKAMEDYMAPAMAAPSSPAH